MYKVFIDGSEGTTGLKIQERFEGRNDIKILKIDPNKRKNKEERRILINESDLTFLCLPDEAAKEAISLIDNQNTRVIDASTAHRTNPQWTYGFPELTKDHREAIRQSKRVAVPGCYASGFIACVYPLVSAGVLPVEYPLTCYGISGYSGGGKKMINQLEGIKPKDCYSPRLYALEQHHKHLPEMQKICGLGFPPMFNPIVDDYYSGMVVSVPLLRRYLAKDYKLDDIHQILADHYQREYFIKVVETGGSQTLTDGFLSADALADTNNMQIFVCGNDEQILVAARFDNLGKGASGAAVQCMNIMLGFDETAGLV